MNTATLPNQVVSNAIANNFSKTLLELLEDGIYLLFLMRNGTPPASTNEFNKSIDQFILQFDKNARNLGKSSEAISDAKYAFCALMDEIVLSSDFSIREDWERSPLQLRLFGEHLAGERFFDKLENLRMDPSKNLEVIEVFHTALLLGFQGKYLLEGSEKLNFLISRLDQEITHARGGKPPFSPNWKLPHRFQEYVRNELPLWSFFALLAVVVTVIFILFNLLLGNHADDLTQKQAEPHPMAAIPSPTATPQAAPTDTAVRLEKNSI